MAMRFKQGCAVVLCLLLAGPVRGAQSVAELDAPVARGVQFLVERQSPDGAWRSDVYAPFKEGDAIAPLVMTVLLPLPQDARLQKAIEPGVAYLAKLAEGLPEAQQPDSIGLIYPVYSTANLLIALHQNRRAEDEALRERCAAALRNLQLTEATGWTPDDPEYGGWSYGHAAPRKPAAGQALGTLDQPNLSATRYAMLALSLHGCNANAAALARGARFVLGLQAPPVDGERIAPAGFVFMHGDVARNKAGAEPGSDDSPLRFRPYGSATADGFNCLTVLPAPNSASRSGIDAARLWFDQNFLTTQHPGDFPADRAAARDGLYYYYLASFAQTYRRLGVRKLLRATGETINWPAEVAAALVKRQRPDGSWCNPVVDQREDDPLVATAFAVEALTHCRALLVADERPAVTQTPAGFVCHARDATCHGEKLLYEPQPQKNTLGYWVNARDHATWTLDVTTPGEFDVVVWQGCGGGQGGSELSISPSDEKGVTFTVEETGHFQHFKPRTVGRLKLAAGPQKLTLRCMHKARGAVADIRQIELQPVK